MPGGSIALSMQSCNHRASRTIPTNCQASRFITGKKIRVHSGSSVV
jgi:hypothetical protein